LQDGDVSHFEAPQKSLAGLDAETAASLVAAAADVALYLDGDGVIRDVSVGSDDPVLEDSRKWIGRAWSETVTVESRQKVAELLQDAAAKAAHRWRHINHPSPRGADVPVLYSAIRISKAGGVLALGRDLRPVATVQQRLVDAQQAMERDYLRLRHMETRYRHLFQSVSEAVLIADAATQRIVDMNAAAGRLLGDTVQRLTGRSAIELFDAAGARAVLAALGGVRASGRTQEVSARLVATRAQVTVSASLFRQENGSSLLIRLLPAQADAEKALAAANAEATLLRVVEGMPDAFVVTDPDGLILTANAAFVEMTQLGAGVQLHGESLERWLGRGGVDLNVLLANLRQHGSVRLFATTLRGEYGSTAQVEISAAAVPHDERPCIGFALRDVGRRLGDAPKRNRELPRSVAQLTELVGRVPLKDIVGETSELIEQLCIEAALQLTGDNRASASEMLGLSRQSLYVKMRRYGLGDLGPEAER
jgi:transcriptional regulator PpsR